MQVIGKTGRFIAVAAMMATLAVMPAMAQDSEDKVIVKVNDHNITASEVAIAADDILPQLREIPPKLRYPFIVEYLVERHLLAQEGMQAGIESSESFKKREAFYRAKALRDAYFTDKLKPQISEEEIRKAYDEQAAKVKPEMRARARHILVETEQAAKDIIAQLEKGADFAELAKANSKDGSKDYGGDLGYFTAKEMVPDFSKAVFAMKPGEISKPIKTDFGWHVVKLEDLKEGGPQPYEEVKEAIRLVLLRKAVQDQILELRKSGKIEIVDPELKKLQELAEKQREELLKKQQEGDQQPTAGGKGDKAN